MKKTGLTLCALLLLAGAAAAEDARVTHQNLHVRFEPKEHRIAGESILTLDPKTLPGRLSFELHTGLEVKEVALALPGSVVPLEFVEATEKDPFVRRVTAEVPPEPKTLLVKVRYEGTLYDPVKKAKDLAFVVGDRTRGVVGEEGVFLVSGSGWYPVTEGMCTFWRIRVEVPEPFRAVTQGKLSHRKVEDGRERTVWLNTLPADGLALQAGEYVVESREVDGVTISTYLYERHQKHAKLFLDDTESYFRLYTELLGPYPHAKFDIVENFFTTGYGMPSYTLLGDDVVEYMPMMAPRYGGHLPPGHIDHELVHCWWGNGVFVDYESGNWCEGLTSYFSNYYRKELVDEVKPREHRQRICTTFAIRVTPENDYPVRAFKGKKEDFENDIGYGKASMIFHMLRQIVGNQVFFGTIREFAREYRGKAAGWTDIERIFSKTSGRDLSWFFTQWLDRKGAPSLRAGEFDVTRREDGRFVVKGEVLQDGEPWRLAVPVTVQHAGGESYKAVRLDGKSASFTIVTPRPPISVSIDRQFNLFRQVPLGEIQPCLQLTRSRPDLLYVVPAGESAYRRLAEMGKASKGGEIVTAGDGLPPKDCVLFGRPEENAAVAKALEAAGVTVEGNAVTVKGRKHEGEGVWLLLSMRHPEAPDRFVTVFFGMTEKALGRARVIYRYGWDGFIVYEGRRPLARGDFTRISQATVRQLHLPATWPSIERNVTELAAKELAGRLAGSEGGKKTREILSKRLWQAGLADVREVPFSFDVHDFDDPDAWTVAQGTLEDGTTRWTTAYPGAVVPACYSPETDGMRIRRIANYGPDVGPETLVMLPPETRAEGLAALVAGAAATGAAAVGIPMSVLESKDPGMANLTAYPSRLAGKLRGGQDPWMAASGRQARAPRPPVPVRVPVVFVDSRLLPPGGEGKADATLRVRFTKRTIESANLVGVIPNAAGRRVGPSVGLGAHYDGLGEGHAGADDNASGVAAVLEAVRGLAARSELLALPVRVVLFGAEEWGLRGSRALAGDLAPSLTALVNLDTVGAKDVPQVYVVGRTEHPELSARAAACLTAEGFEIGKDIDRFAFRHGSDHWPFHEAGVPAIDLFSGAYRRMNTKADTVDLVDARKVARIARATARLVLDLAAGEPPEPIVVETIEPGKQSDRINTSATVFPGEEKHLTNIRMLTDGGENAEAYFPTEEDRLVFQSKRSGLLADQIFVMGLDGSGVHMVSNGKGATTCSYLFPGMDRVLYATTAFHGDAPPEPPDRSKGYVWKLHPEFDIVAHDLDGKNEKRLTEVWGYDAEATVSRDGQWVVFTSCRTGDPEIYKMRPDGTELTRLTNAEGYDGGPFFSFDGKQIVWRANRPETADEKEKYRVLREEGLISPMRLEVFVMDADGKNQRQVTDYGAASFAPFFHPDGKRIIFSSNLGSKGKRGMPNFDLHMVNVDGTGLVRITHCPQFDGFPMFTADGKRLVFCSNRDNRGTRETNVFIADWAD
ncbi:MAG: M20/M25/M40 family metallo-hydrolase [Planctomycetota bacterium]|jgi:hypothetical protein